VLHLEELAPRTPQLPRRRSGALTHLAASAALHATLVLAVATLVPTPQPSELGSLRPKRSVEPLGRIVFLAPLRPHVGGGGGGGGNQQSGPIRRAQSVGSDAVTLRTRKTPPPAAPVAAPAALATDEVPQLPAILLDATRLASGIFEQTGLPAAALVSGTSTGPGFGGGVGTGIGTGIGSGRGPGLGPGSGGGTGGGTYRPGGAVSAPRLITQVKPGYTPQALHDQIQGPVVLELIVTREGFAQRIRVVKSLDPGGLDEEAALAVAQWRFEPGRLAGEAVDVIVTIRLDFAIR
jgi:protein TonB